MHDSRDMVQIIIPCFNGEEYLEETLHSIQNQTHNNFDCLMVDDGSTDISTSIFKTFALSDSRFRMLKNETNRGESYAVNKGWKNRRSDLISILSCDDPQPKDWLESMLLLVNTCLDSQVNVFYPNRNIIDSRGNCRRREYLLNWNHKFLFEDFICIPSVGALIDARDLPSDFQPRIESIGYPSDLIQFIKLSFYGKGLRHPNYFCNWRNHEENKSSIPENLLSEKIQEGLEKYFESSGLTLSAYQKTSLATQVLRIQIKGDQNTRFGKAKLLWSFLKDLRRRPFINTYLISKVFSRFILRKILIRKNSSFVRRLN